MIQKNYRAAVAGRFPALRLSQKTCAGCGVRLDIHQAVRGEVCGEPVCRRKHAAEQAVRRRQAEGAAVRRAVGAFRARVASALGVTDPESLTLAIVPQFNHPVVKLSKARRREFRTHLIRVVRQAFEEKLDEAGAAALAAELAQAVTPPPEFPQGAVACATCRGHCCRTGGNHAYLSATVVGSYLARHPGLGWREVGQAFLRALPGAAFEDSCVYHARRGCALPREMRSALCNQFQCEGFKELREALAASGPRPVLVVAASGEKTGRSTLAQLDGVPVRLRKGSNFSF